MIKNQMLFKQMYKFLTALERYSRGIYLFDVKDKCSVNRIIDLREHLIPINYIKSFQKELRDQSLSNDKIISGDFGVVEEIGQEEMLGMKLFKSKSDLKWLDFDWLDPEFYGGRKDSSDIQRQLLDLSSMCADLKNESNALQSKLLGQE